MHALRGFPPIFKVVSFLYYKPVYALSILLPFLKITTTIVIQYVAVYKSAQPKRETFIYSSANINNYSRNWRGIVQG
jgi:hypothetical protein